jgi:MinD superfamily P-loop ATPase
MAEEVESVFDDEWWDAHFEELPDAEYDTCPRCGSCTDLDDTCVRECIFCKQDEE